MSDTGTAQGQAVGKTLMGLGGTAVMFAAVALVSKLELNFIDATGMAGFGLLMFVTGAFQHGLVRPRGLRTKAFK